MVVARSDDTAEDAARKRIRHGGLRGAELLAWLARRDPRERDSAVEKLLGISHPPPAVERLDADLIDYHPSGVAPIVRAVVDAPVGPDDLFVDLGAGLGKVTLLVHLLTGARARGIELQPALVGAAQNAAARLGLDLSYVAADARKADLGDGTVFFLYLPFTGAALARVMARLREVAAKHAIVVCALGLDLRDHDWLAARDAESFWLTIYDSRCPGVAPGWRPPSCLSSLAEDIASER